MTGSLLQEQCAGMLICWIHHVRETQFLGQFQPVWERLHSHHICSHGTALLCRAKSNRTQTTDVIDDHAITLLETLDTRADALDNTTRLVASNDATVCLGACPLVVRSVDGA